MFSGLATKMALKKVGLSSNPLDFSSLTGPAADSRQSAKLTKRPTDGAPGLDHGEPAAGWASWMSLKSLPLTVHPWLAPPPPPVAVARVPHIGDVAPRDRDRQLEFGGGRRVLVVFLRCVGCACKLLFPLLRLSRSPMAGHLSSPRVNNPSPMQSPKKPSSTSAPSQTATPPQ